MIDTFIHNAQNGGLGMVGVILFVLTYGVILFCMTKIALTFYETIKQVRRIRKNEREIDELMVAIDDILNTESIKPIKNINKHRFTKPRVNPDTGQIDLRYNPLNMEQDYYL